MSRIVFQSEGLSELIKDVSGYTKELNKEISFAITDNIEAVEKHAKKNHRFGKTGKNVYSKSYQRLVDKKGTPPRTGKLEQSVSHEYPDPKGGAHKVKIFLNDKMTTLDNGKSYGTYIHEGTYQGYKQSKIAPSYSSSHSKSGKGWEADPFLWRAIDQKWKMTRDLKKITANLKKKYTRV